MPLFRRIYPIMEKMVAGSVLSREKRAPVAKVLLVDNSPSNNHSMASYLNASGFSVASLPDTDLPLSLLSALRPDLILVNDAAFPKGDSVEFISSLSAIYSAPLVLYGLEDGKGTTIKKLVVARSPRPDSEALSLEIQARLEDIIQGYSRFHSRRPISSLVEPRM
jgi:CheY-like chemotaxis protein